MSRKQVKVFTSRERLNEEPVVVSPDPGGNRAQRRAWKKLTKNKGAKA